jgi:hypothetical protein
MLFMCLDSVYRCVHLLPPEDMCTEHYNQAVSVLNAGLIYIVYKHNTTTVSRVTESFPHGVQSSCRDRNASNCVVPQ